MQREPKFWVVKFLFLGQVLVSSYWSKGHKSIDPVKKVSIANLSRFPRVNVDELVSI